MKRLPPKTRTRPSELTLLRDLILGGRHSRSTVAAMGVSLPTADRWLQSLLRTVPGVTSFKQSHVTWFEWKEPAASRTALKAIEALVYGADPKDARRLIGQLQGIFETGAYGHKRKPR